MDKVFSRCVSFAETPKAVTCVITVILYLLWRQVSQFFSPCRPELLGLIVEQVPRSSWPSLLCVSREWHGLLVARGGLPIAGDTGESLLCRAVRRGDMGLLKMCMTHPLVNKVR